MTGRTTRAHSRPGVGGAPVSCRDARLASLLARSCGSQPLLEVLAAQLSLHGNAFVQIVKDGAGVPVELYPLRPERVQVVAGDDGWPAAYRYVLADRTLTIPIEDEDGWPNIVHLKGFHPTDDHYGAGSLAAAVSIAVRSSESAVPRAATCAWAALSCVSSSAARALESFNCASSSKLSSEKPCSVRDNLVLTVA